MVGWCRLAAGGERRRVWGGIRGSVWVSEFLVSVVGSVLAVGLAAGGGRRRVGGGIRWCHWVGVGGWLGEWGIWFGSGEGDVAEFWCQLGGMGIWLGFHGIWFGSGESEVVGWRF